MTTKLAPDLLSTIALAAYSYMALVPIIQPPIIKLLTTKAERQVKMTQARTVSQKEKIIFPDYGNNLCQPFGSKCYNLGWLFDAGKSGQRN